MKNILSQKNLPHQTCLNSNNYLINRQKKFNFKHKNLLILEYNEPEIINDKAIQPGYINLTYQEASFNEKIYEGEGIINLKYVYEWWSINGIDIPGIRI